MDEDHDAGGRARDRTRDALLVARLRDGDERAFGEIYDLWYDRVHDLARRIVRDDGRAADVAQDTFLNAWRRIDGLADPASLGGWLLRIARNRALNVLEKERRATAVDDESIQRIEAAGPTVNAPDGFRVADLAHDGDPARAVEHAEVAALLWEAADALGERDRTVLDLQLRHGLSPAEIGEVVGVNRNAANQLVHRVKARLEGAVEARVLWRGDRPGCEALKRALDAAGVDRFDSRAVTITNNHAGACDECGERQQRRLQPAALFGALPIVVAPLALKQQAAAALAAEGVPMHGSTALTGPGGAGPGPGQGGGPVVAPSAAPSAPDGTGTARHGRGRRRAVVAAGVLVLFALAAGIGVAVGRDADGEEVRSGPAPTVPDQVASAPAPTGTLEADTTTPAEVTTTTGPSTTTTSSTTSTPTPTSPAAGPPAGGDPPLVVPPAGPGTSAPPAPPTTPAPVAPTTTTTPAPTATASIRISPSTVSDTYLQAEAPRLTWSATGGASVVVSGPQFSSTARSGDLPVCPTDGTATWSVCIPFAAAPTARYQIRVYDGDGDVLVSRSAFLTIT